MLFPIAIYFFYLIFSLSIYWSVRLFFNNKSLSLTFLLLINTLFIFLASPLIFLFLFVEFILILIIYKFIKDFELDLRISWLTIIPLFLLSGPLIGNSYYKSTLDFFSGLTYLDTPYFIGGTFIVLKAFIILKQWIKKDNINFLESLVSLTFIPSFPAGPIHGSKEWSKESISKNLSKETLTFKTVITAICRIFWGISSLMIISRYLTSLVPTFSSGDLTFFYGSYIKFVALFFDFSGYSSIAIGSAMLFGVKLPENFNQPFLATNIQEFWQRWHMSMSGFIGTYIYKTYVRVTNQRRIGIFIAFVFAGLWHKISIPFLIWGIGHGFLMAFTPKLEFDLISNTYIKKILGWFVTFNFVSILSAFATGYINVR